MVLTHASDSDAQRWEQQVNDGCSATLSARAPRWLSLLMVAATATGAVVFGNASVALARTGTNDYPYSRSAADQLDRWSFDTRECTSFVAWRINNDAKIAFSDSYGGVEWGDARNWANAARQVGVPVNTTPTVGSVAMFPPGVDGADKVGHVAWVLAIGKGKVTVEDYNYADAYDHYQSHAYSQHVVATSRLSFIHFYGTTGATAGPEGQANTGTGKYRDLDRSL